MKRRAVMVDVDERMSAFKMMAGLRRGGASRFSVIPGFDIFREGGIIKCDVGEGEIEEGDFHELVYEVSGVYDSEKSGEIGYIVREWLGGRLSYGQMYYEVKKRTSERGLCVGGMRTSFSEFMSSCLNSEDVLSWRQMYLIYF